MAATLTRDQVRRVDEWAVSRYGIAGIVLMENAGRNAAAIIDREYGPRGRAIIFCGTGNNGGDGCVIARHLHNLRWPVRLALTGDETKMSPEMLANFRVVEAMKLEWTLMADQSDRVSACGSIREDEIVIDAMLGTGFRGQVRDDFAEIIEGINHARKRAVVCIDVPSGLDCESGKPGGKAVRADLTVTFVAQKTGFAKPGAQDYVGRTEVVDIGAPRELIEEAART
jgi:NAD(P)H-hydrate epimerase